MLARHSGDFGFCKLPEMTFQYLKKTYFFLALLPKRKKNQETEQKAVRFWSRSLFQLACFPTELPSAGFPFFIGRMNKRWISRENHRKSSLEASKESSKRKSAEKLEGESILNCITLSEPCDLGCVLLVMPSGQQFRGEVMIVIEWGEPRNQIH